MGEFYFKISESDVEEMAHRVVWEVVEAVLDACLPDEQLVHHLGHHTTQLGNRELLQSLKDCADEIAAADGSSLRQAYVRITSTSAHLSSNGYTPVQLQAFVAKSAGNFQSPGTRENIEHAHESARHIVASIREGTCQR